MSTGPYLVEYVPAGLRQAGRSARLIRAVLSSVHRVQQAPEQQASGRGGGASWPHGVVAVYRGAGGRGVPQQPLGS